MRCSVEEMVSAFVEAVLEVSAYISEQQLYRQEDFVIDCSRMQYVRNDPQFATMIKPCLQEIFSGRLFGGNDAWIMPLFVGQRRVRCDRKKCRDIMENCNDQVMHIRCSDWFPWPIRITALQHKECGTLRGGVYVGHYEFKRMPILDFRRSVSDKVTRIPITVDRHARNLKVAEGDYTTGWFYGHLPVRQLSTALQLCLTNFFKKMAIPNAHQMAMQYFQAASLLGVDNAFVDDIGTCHKTNCNCGYHDWRQKARLCWGHRLHVPACVSHVMGASQVGTLVNAEEGVHIEFRPAVELFKNAVDVGKVFKEITAMFTRKGVRMTALCANFFGVWGMQHKINFFTTPKCYSEDGLDGYSLNGCCRKQAPHRSVGCCPCERCDTRRKNNMTPELVFQIPRELMAGKALFPYRRDYAWDPKGECKEYQFGCNNGLFDGVSEDCALDTYYQHCHDDLYAHPNVTNACREKRRNLLCVIPRGDADCDSMYDDVESVLTCEEYRCDDFAGEEVDSVYGDFIISSGSRFDC